MKLSEDEYIEKLLLDFGYQNEGYNTVSKTDRKALPINDERILIKLNNPKIKLDRDFSPIAEKQEMEIIPPKTENKDPIPPVNETNNSGPSSQTQTQDSKKIVDLSFLQNEISAKNKRKNFFCFQCFIVIGEIESHQSQEIASIKEGKATPSKPALDKANKSPTNAKTRTAETKVPLTVQKEKPELKRSLALDFQEVDKEPEPVEEMNLPGQSQEMGSNRDLEALLCRINYGNPSQQEKTPIGGAKPPTNTNQDKAPSILSSQIHQILYSKPINFIDADSDFDENEEIGRKSSMFYSFEEPCFDDNKENFDINIIEKNEFYNLTDYSSNSSSNENSYIYHEEDESLDGPAKQPKMFNFYDQINMSFKDQCTTCNNVQPNNTQGELYGSQDTNPFANLHTGGLFSNLGSQNPKPMGSQESQNTMFADCVYYLKQRENQMGFDDDIDMIKEKKLSKLKDSPKKKTKRLFCNNKKIPLWATDLKEVEKVSRNQKSMFNSNVIFGFFSVDNLDLVEVFQMSNHRLLKPRYFVLFGFNF